LSKPEDRQTDDGDAELRRRQQARHDHEGHEVQDDHEISISRSQRKASSNSRHSSGPVDSRPGRGRDSPKYLLAVNESPGEERTSPSSAYTRPTGRRLTRLRPPTASCQSHAGINPTIKCGSTPI